VFVVSVVVSLPYTLPVLFLSLPSFSHRAPPATVCNDRWPPRRARYDIHRRPSPNFAASDGGKPLCSPAVAVVARCVTIASAKAGNRLTRRRRRALHYNNTLQRASSSSTTLRHHHYRPYLRHHYLHRHRRATYFEDSRLRCIRTAGQDTEILHLRTLSTSFTVKLFPHRYYSLFTPIPRNAITTTSGLICVFRLSEDYLCKLTDVRK